MNIKVSIQRNQIHHWINADLSEVLEFGMRCPEYPDLPTYGMRIDYPINQNKILTAIQNRLILIRDQITRDNLIRQQIETMGYLNFTVTIPD